MERWSSALVDMHEDSDTVRSASPRRGAVESDDPSSERVWWSDAGVHQNITFPVHPDPISGMHCWHQKVRVRPAARRSLRGHHVDFARARQVYRKWLALARPASGELAARSGCSGRSSRHSTPTACPTTAHQRARTAPPQLAQRVELHRHVDWNPAEAEFASISTA